MKKNEIWNSGYYKVANTSAIIAVLLLSAFFAFETMIFGGIPLGWIGFCLVAALAIIIFAIVFTKDYTSLALLNPGVLFIFYTALMIMDGWKASNYLLICLCFCGISCLYSNFLRTILYVILQNIVIGVLIIRGVPVIGQNIPLPTVLITWLFTLFGLLVLLLLTRSATVILNSVIDEVNSFRNLLSTTENYVAMLDNFNHVIHVSKPLSQLTKIEDPELTKGRPLVDLFPGRELKLLVGKMLRQKEKYAEDWEFTLNGQKRFFKVTSTISSGASEGALVNLHDLTSLAERDEIAVMKDSLKIGFFFMDRKYIIQAHYSRFLEEMLSETDLAGKCFSDLLSTSVTAKELDSILDYFNMIFEQTFDQSTLDDINPLSQFKYINRETGGRKVFQCDFTPVERGELFVLVTIYDITARTELQEQLREEETKRQEEMQSIFELIQVDRGAFGDFLEDVEYEFGRIDHTLKNSDISTHQVLVEVYQSVHAIKSNSVILGLNVFGNKVHSLESKIKVLREQEEEVSFSEMLNLTMELEKLSQEKEGFKATIEKIQTLTGGSKGVKEGGRQGKNVLAESLIKTAEKAAADMGKKVQFVVEGIDSEAVEKGPRRVMKEVLMQLVRNCVAHGVEPPEERLARGKNETGVIRLSIKLVGEKIHVKLGDDGGGLDFDKIRKKAEQMHLIKKEDGNNKDLLLKAIFAPGFSTAETEGVHAGRGIGLNLVRDRVRDVKGSIKLQSEPGKGTIFNIFIPLANNKAESKAS